MPATTPNDNLRYPVGTDLLPVEDHIQALAEDVDGKYIKPTLVDAKGDLLVATGPDTLARKLVGADGKVLVSDSSKADGLTWADQNYQRVAADPLASAVPSTYPLGGSQLFLTNGLAQGWPVDLGVVLTFREADLRTVQVVISKSGTERFTRGANTTGTGWDAFEPLGNARQATGSYTGNGGVDRTIALPWQVQSGWVWDDTARKGWQVRMPGTATTVQIDAVGGTLTLVSRPTSTSAGMLVSSSSNTNGNSFFYSVIG